MTYECPFCGDADVKLIGVVDHKMDEWGRKKIRYLCRVCTTGWIEQSPQRPRSIAALRRPKVAFR